MRAKSTSRSRGQIIPKGDGKWLVRVYIGRDLLGKRKYSSKTIEGTYQQADQELTKMLREQDTGTFVEPSKLTLAAYLEQWLETKTGISPKTLRDYVHLLGKHVIPNIGFYKLAQLTPLLISKLYGSLLSDRKCGGRGLSPRTVRYTHSVLSQALEQAVVWNMVARNPCTNVELPRMKQGGSGDTLSFEETAQFLSHPSQLTDRLQALWRLLLTAGLRPQEALALKWSDFSSGNAVTISRVLSELAPGSWEPKDGTKTGLGRNVVLSAETSLALTKHRSIQAAEILKAGPKYTRNDFIFATRVGTHCTPPDIRKWWKAALTAANIRQIRLYDTRHTNISQELAAGGNVDEVARRHGHDTSTMLRTYAHVVPGVNQGVPQEIERRLTAALKREA